MTEYRFARSDEDMEVLDFINFVFSQAARPHDFEKLIPKAYAHPGFAGLHAVAVEDGRIHGTVAMLPVVVHAGENTLKAGYIGSVSVHPRFRGRGHMKELMRMQIEEARRRGYDFMSLGGQRQRYLHFGFVQYGNEYCFSLNQANVRHALPKETPFTFALAEECHAAAMAALHEGQTLYCERPRLMDALRTYGGVPYVILNGTVFSGYLVARGDRVTELCLCRESDLAAVMAAWMRGRKNCEILCGGEMTQRIQGLNAFAETYSISPSAMIKILNWENVLRAMMNIRPLTEGERVIQIENTGAFRLKSENGRTEVTPCNAEPDYAWTETEAIETLFSPLKAQTVADPTLRAWLPLSLDIAIADQF